jgi:hypothetical protein
MKFTRLGAFTLGVVITAVSVGAVSFVNAAGDATLKACADKKSGAMRYIAKGKCKKTETSLSWNQMGPQGLAGSSGAAGTKGDTGTPGRNGANGSNATLAITEQSVCDGSDAGVVADEVCKIGMTGPGGGQIFYVDYHNVYPTYDYLELAPTDAATGVVWATTVQTCGVTSSSNCQLNSLYNGANIALRETQFGLFGGKKATELIIAKHASVPKSNYAAGVSDDYVSNGLEDWWLPSLGEWETAIENLGFNGLVSNDVNLYWTSSEPRVNAASAFVFTMAWNMEGGSTDKNDLFPRVRAVRGF